MQASTIAIAGIAGFAGTVLWDSTFTDQSRAAAVETILQNQRYAKAVDLGCGQGKFGNMLKKYADIVIGIDRDPSTLKLAAEKNAYDMLIVSDVKDFVPERDTDLVIMIEVIEHLDKQDGIALLDRLDEVRNIVITTPAKFFEDNLSLGENLQKHRSLWTEQELQQRGFAVSRVQLSWLSSWLYNYTIIAYKSQATIV